jgi:succinate dehydrogenase / fumarate reductase cytochrome b subunit
MTAIAAPRFLRSTIGKKVVMALTGVILYGFVLAHMLGNLQAYLGPDKLNAYSAFLHSVPSLLWGARTVLLLSVAAHIAVAIQLSQLKRSARPVAYAMQQNRQATYASRTMMWSGPIIALFVVYHLLHFTTGQAHHDFQPSDVYHNFVSGFQVLPASLVYIAANAALGVHLYHGGFSLFQSLGLTSPRYNPTLKTVTGLATFGVVVANISFPLAVLAGIIQ